MQNELVLLRVSVTPSLRGCEVFWRFTGPYTTCIHFQSIIKFIRTRNVRQHRQSPGRARVTKVKSAHADDIFIHRPHSSLSDAMTDRRAAPNEFDGQSLTRREIRG